MVGRNLIENKATENYSLLYPDSKELDLTKIDEIKKWIK